MIPEQGAIGIDGREGPLICSIPGDLFPIPNAAGDNNRGGVRKEMWGGLEEKVVGGGRVRVLQTVGQSGAHYTWTVTPLLSGTVHPLAGTPDSRIVESLSLIFSESNLDLRGDPNVYFRESLQSPQAVIPVF